MTRQRDRVLRFEQAASAGGRCRMCLYVSFDLLVGPKESVGPRIGGTLKQVVGLGR